MKFRHESVIGGGLQRNHLPGRVTPPWRLALSVNPISIDLHASQPSAADAISVDGGNDFDAQASWGEILVTIAMSAVALGLVTFFALVIGNA